LILLDANVLVYAFSVESPHHESARAWFEKTINGAGRVGFPWPTLLAFVRLLGNPTVLRKPVPVKHAWARIEGWLELPQAWIPLPTERHRDVLAQLLDGETRADRADDAHLAALAIEHGLTVCSTDRDFSRFPGVRWENPLTP
jgi:toxin-antitoxin system PIN domain toxin